MYGHELRHEDNIFQITRNEEMFVIVVCYWVFFPFQKTLLRDLRMKNTDSLYILHLKTY